MLEKPGLTERVIAFITSFQDRKKRRVELSEDDEKEVEKQFRFLLRELTKNLATVRGLLEMSDKRSQEFIFGTYQLGSNVRINRINYVLTGKDMEKSILRFVPYDRLYPKHVLELENLHSDNDVQMDRRVKILSRYQSELLDLYDKLQRSDLLIMTPDIIESTEDTHSTE